MANEVTIGASIAVQQGSLIYESRPKQFNADMTGKKGPTPGAVSIEVAGTDISLAELTTPGFARLVNLDTTNYVEFGIWDGLEFIAVGELGPGEISVFKFSRNFGNSVGTGTATTDTGNTFRMKASVAACNCLVEVFEV